MPSRQGFRTDERQNAHADNRIESCASAAVVEAEQAVLGGLMLAPDSPHTDQLTKMISTDATAVDLPLSGPVREEQTIRRGPCEWFDANGLAEQIGSAP